MSDQPQVKDRITVIEAVYHQKFGEQPTMFESRFSRELKTDEQVYERRCKAGQEWQPLDLGWVKDVGMIVICNEEGHFLHTNPTDAEKAEADGRVLQLSGNEVGPEWSIPPRESMRGCPVSASGLKIRCIKGTARFTILVYPE